MTDSSDDVNAILASKSALQYDGANLAAMRAIADAHRLVASFVRVCGGRSNSLVWWRNRSLQNLRSALNDHAAELSEDTVIHGHLEGVKRALVSWEGCIDVCVSLA